MEQGTLRAIIALTLIHNIGAQRIRKLIKKAGSAEAVFETPPAVLMQIDGIGKSIAAEITGFKDWKQVDKVMEVTEKTDAWLMDGSDPDYPEKLSHIFDPPLLIWGMGDKKALAKPGVAVIGTRNISSYGRQMAEYFTKELTAAGLSIISGLALGVDTVAHQTSLKNGGITTGVLGSGIDWIYPAINKGLAGRIAENGGAVITEFPPGTKPDAGNFPVRNRVVSGLSLGVLVIESDVTGGSMITANLALEQGREVFIVPHNLGSTTGRGCNAMIKKGAGKLVQNLDDILSEIEIHLDGYPTAEKASETPAWSERDLSPDQQKICEILDGQPAVTADILFEKTGLSMAKLLPLMLELELEGLVESLSGNRYRLKPRM